MIIDKNNFPGKRSNGGFRCFIHDIHDSWWISFICGGHEGIYLH